jgi:hypothetical protein
MAKGKDKPDSSELTYQTPIDRIIRVTWTKGDHGLRSHLVKSVRR